jgi:hypothetical protein
MAGPPHIPESGFDPETVELLSRALAIAWKKAESAGVRFDGIGEATTAQEILAASIVRQAQTGERDVTLLADNALTALAAAHGL